MKAPVDMNDIRFVHVDLYPLPHSCEWDNTSFDVFVGFFLRYDVKAHCIDSGRPLLDTRAHGAPGDMPQSHQRDPSAMAAIQCTCFPASG